MASYASRIRRIGNTIWLGLALCHFLALAPLLAADEPEQREYINTPEDLAHHFKLHIARVRKLGLELYAQHQIEFRGISKTLVEQFLSFHDRTKIDTSETFRSRYWVDPSNEDSFINRLWSIYGKFNREADPIKRKVNITLVKSLNTTDQNVAMQFFRRKGLLTSNGELTDGSKMLLRIERIADVVDRNTDPVAMEEFNLPQQRPLSDFITNPIDLDWATQLKSQYETITAGLQFIKNSIEDCASRVRKLIRSHPK